jgi:hypothetical protein
MRRKPPLHRAIEAAALATALLLGACEDEDAAPSNTREFAAKAYGNPVCDVKDGRLTARRQLRLFVNGGLDIDSTITGLQRYYRRHGLTFFASTTVETTDLHQVQDLDSETLNAKLHQDFPGQDLSDAALTALAASDRPLFDRIVTAIMRFQFSGVLSFLERYHLEGQDVTNVVLLQDLVTAKSPPEVRDSLLGVALSPFLLTELARTGMDAQRTIPLVGLSPDFAPVVFIGNRNVKLLETRLGAVNRDLVVAHEFGHSAGLVHRNDSTNLMNPSTTGRESCAQALSDEQIEVMQRGLGLAGKTGTGMARVVRGQDGQRADPWPSPALIAGVIRGDPQAQRALLAPFQGD